MAQTISVNGAPHSVPDDPRVTLLDFLRQDVGLTGTKKGCDHGQCGACTVIVNGVRINSCLTLAAMHDGDSVTTIEGLGTPDAPSPLQRAFLEHDGFQVQGPVRMVQDSDGIVDLQSTMAGIPDLVESGVTDCRLALRLSPEPEEAADLLGRAVEAFRSAVGRDA